MLTELVAGFCRFLSSLEQTIFRGILMSILSLTEPGTKLDCSKLYLGWSTRVRPLKLVFTIDLALGFLKTSV